MKHSDILIENAENCLKLAEDRSDQPSFKRFRRMAKAWLALAREKDWLDGVIRPHDQRYILQPVRIDRRRVNR